MNRLTSWITGLCFHRWGKWTDFVMDVGYAIPNIEFGQHRICQKCGLRLVRKVEARDMTMRLTGSHIETTDIFGDDSGLVLRMEPTTALGKKIKELLEPFLLKQDTQAKIQCGELPGGRQDETVHWFPRLDEGVKCYCGKMENYRDGEGIGEREVKDNETLPELH